MSDQDLPVSGRPRIVSQASLILGGQLLSGLVLVFTTPVIALGLGPEQYGLYTLLFVFLGYSATLDLGLSFALVKYLAERNFNTERNEVNAFLDTASAVYSCIAVLFTLTLVLGRDWIAVSLLQLPPNLVPVAEDSLLAVACSIPFLTAMGVFTAVFSGLLRFEFVAAFGLANSSVYAIGAMFLVRTGSGLTVVIGFYSALMALSTFAQWLVLRSIVPGFRIIPRLRWPKVKQLFGFGGYMLLNRLGRIGLQQIDRLVVARLLSVSMAAYYAVPLQVTQRIAMLGGAVATVAFPVSSAKAAHGQMESFRSEYLQSARVLGWLSLVPTLVVVILADRILFYWMTPQFAEYGTWPMRILAVGTWFLSVTSLDAAAIQGTGRPGIIAVFLALTGAANVVLLLVLTRSAGLLGVSLSVTASLIVLSLLQVWFCCRNVVQWPIGVWFRTMMGPTFATTAITIPVLLAIRIKVSGLISLVAAVVIGAAFCGMVGYRLFLSEQERRWVVKRAAQLLVGRQPELGK